MALLSHGTFHFQKALTFGNGAKNNLISPSWFSER